MIIHRFALHVTEIFQRRLKRNTRHTGQQKATSASRICGAWLTKGLKKRQKWLPNDKRGTAFELNKMWQCNYVKINKGCIFN